MLVSVKRKVKVHKRRKAAADRRKQAELHRLVEAISPDTYDDAIGFLKVLASIE